MLGIDERSVWDAYAWLEARGFIERPHRKGNRTVVGVIPIEQVVQNLKGIKQASYPSEPRGKTRKSKTSEAACTETSEVGFGGSPGASLLSERKGKEEPSSERNVKVSSSMQAADQTPVARSPTRPTSRRNKPARHSQREGSSGSASGKPYSWGRDNQKPQANARPIARRSLTQSVGLSRSNRQRQTRQGTRCPPNCCKGPENTARTPPYFAAGLWSWLKPKPGGETRLLPTVYSAVSWKRKSSGGCAVTLARSIFSLRRRSAQTVWSLIRSQQPKAPVPAGQQQPAHHTAFPFPVDVQKAPNPGGRQSRRHRQNARSAVTTDMWSRAVRSCAVRVRLVRRWMRGFSNS